MQSHILPRTLIAAALLFGVSVGEAAEDAVPTEGAASCRASSEQPADCVVEWTWRRAPRAYGWIQQFDHASARWRSVSLAPSSRSGVSQETVEDGHLYRVLGCDDPRGSHRSAASGCSPMARSPAAF